MASSHCRTSVSRRALRDQKLSSEAVAIATSLIAGIAASELGFPASTMDLAFWELETAGHLNRGGNDD